MCYPAGMTKPSAHPFTIHIAAAKQPRSMFIWSIGRRGMVQEYAPVTYATPEEARLAGKIVLDRTIAAWQDSHATDLSGRPEIEGCNRLSGKPLQAG
jgi:hypothetical protein